VFEFVGSIARNPLRRSSVSATNCSTCSPRTSGVVRPPTKSLRKNVSRAPGSTVVSQDSRAARPADEIR
jgi:hypothetical protein